LDLANEETRLARISNTSNPAGTAGSVAQAWNGALSSCRSAISEMFEQLSNDKPVNAEVEKACAD